MPEPTPAAPVPPAPGRRAPWPAVAVVVVVVVVAAGIGLVARGSGDDRGASPSLGAAATTAPTTPAVGLGEGVAPERDGRAPLRGFGEVLVTITDADGDTCEACLLAATDAAQRERGLMEVTDPELGGYDGMLFEYPEPITGAFWMRNTPMALSIAYFDEDRALVSAAHMEPCGDVDTCPTYASNGPFRYALEVPRGELGDLLVTPGSTFTIDARSCPAADEDA